MKKQSALIALASLLITSCTIGQPLHQKRDFTRQDSLRGSITPERAWWNVSHYNIEVQPDYASQTIKGSNEISFTVNESGHKKVMQIDMQEPMQIDSVRFNNMGIAAFKREGNAYFINFGKTHFTPSNNYSIKLFFSGKPRRAVTPPWDGGWIWTKDKNGRPWMSVACQGLGASVWYPCKDHQSDEPDKGALFTIHVPDSLVAVANGRMKNQVRNQGLASYTWEVTNPINNYNIVPYIGKYVNWKDTLNGEKGKLDLTFWTIDYNLDKARKQFAQVKPTIHAFEYWFGPYAFYEDGFQLVEAPHLGMEHQSAVAYGNQFKNGYLGNDLSGTGHGLKWDFIIVHETGHEWFGNNITTKDIADMWVHEGFTNYSEVLFTQRYWGKKAGDEYAIGIRKNIDNDIPVIGHYGVNMEGSGDMYAKGASMIHTIRQVINNDEKFRSLLRGLGKDFYQQTVTTQQVENYISQKTGIDFSKVFDQYLRTTDIPLLQFDADDEKLKFRWTNVVAGFNMPVRLTNGKWIHPTTDWQKLKIEGMDFDKVKPDPNFYIKVKKP